MIETLSIDSFDLVHIFLLYGIFFVLAVITSQLIQRIYDRFVFSFPGEDRDPSFTLRGILLAGPKEEIIFRGTTVFLFSVLLGWNTPRLFLVLMITLGVWAGMHSRDLRTVIFTFVIGFYWTLFWLDGFRGLWWMAIVMHSLHNLIVWSLFKTE